MTRPSRRKWIIVGLLWVAAIALAISVHAQAPTPGPPARVVIADAFVKTFLVVGKPYPVGSVQLYVRDSAGTKLTQGVRWFTTNPGAVSITQAGLATAVHPGEVLISAMIPSGLSAWYRVGAYADSTQFAPARPGPVELSWRPIIRVNP